VHLVGFIIKKFVKMHGHVNVKLDFNFTLVFLFLSIWENIRGSPFYFTPINVYTEWNLLVYSLVSLVIKKLTRKRYFWISKFFFNFWLYFTEVQRIPTNINFLLSLSSITCFHLKAILKTKVLIFCRRRPSDDIFLSKPVVFENNNKNTV
jgi:hypothetical protein